VGNTAAKVEITLAMARQHREAWDKLAIRSQEQLEQWKMRPKELEIVRGYNQKMRQMSLEIERNVVSNRLVNRQLEREQSSKRSLDNQPITRSEYSRSGRWKIDL